jgi:2-succinyl-5-enolpyruvyl-6-hydroxy-3-cyclohexene-1-carboxylate synthase
MPHPTQHIRDLAEICRKKNLERIIISPGSRSAPLIRVFVETFGEKCISIVDERSAAYFALGIAAYLRKPVALLCTSGTAVLNYAPALAEAYYQHIPLLAITADRPREWIDQQDNQTLRQNNIYRNYIKGSFDMPQVITTADDLWYAHRIINEAFNQCITDPCGPVHINFPLTEPLYNDLPIGSADLRIIDAETPELSVKLPDHLIQEWKNARRIMIIHGQDHPASQIEALLKPLLKDPRIMILAENISNLNHQDILSNSNLVLSVSRGKSPEYPDLIIHSGGQVVSKALAGYLRKADPIKCWRIGNDYTVIDTYKHVTCILSLSPEIVYKVLARYIQPGYSPSYRKNWLSMAEQANRTAEERISPLPFCDIHVFRAINSLIPEGAVVALGNSSVIRYSQLFASGNKIRYFSNRGTSGIDGCLSTSAGIASASSNLTIAIVGDIGFLYDSNALWNRKLPSNLRIVVVNNKGGGIFHIIKGPSEHPGFKNYIEAHHPVNIAKLAEAYGLKVYGAEDVSTVKNLWPEFIGQQKVPALFEIRTDAGISASSFRKLMMSS